MLERLIHRMRIRIISANVSRLLQSLTDNQILLYDVDVENEMSATVTVTQKSFLQIQQIAAKYQDKIEILEEPKSKMLVRFLKFRWMYLLGMTFIIFLTIFIPTRVYFFEISGNESVPELRILEVLSECGLDFGAKRKSINSEALKNALLQNLPELDWTGITTKGCLATIEVREKEPIDRETDTMQAISSIVAERDGYIESITVTKGYPQCKPGQSVQKGQVLISGYEDCGLLIRGTQADGIIVAKTFRNNQMISPTIIDLRTEKSGSIKKYSLQIGKKLINFNNSSGISPCTCVKIRERKYLTLPGGFRLPVSWICEEIILYQSDTVPQTDADLAWMETSLEQYIVNQTVDGEILQRTTTKGMYEDYCVLLASYACREKIGKTKIEEILNFYGKNN